MRIVVLIVVALTVSACSFVDDLVVEQRFCTLAACSAFVDIDAESVEGWAGPDVVRLDVCVGDECGSAAVADIANRGTNGLIGGQPATFEIVDGDYRFHLGWGHDDPELNVSVSASTPNGVHVATGRVEFDIYYPNGPDCPSPCVVAFVSIGTDDAVHRVG